VEEKENEKQGTGNWERGTGRGMGEEGKVLEELLTFLLLYCICASGYLFLLRSLWCDYFLLEQVLLDAFISRNKGSLGFCKLNIDC
jgi:hypothetical protein